MEESRQNAELTSLQKYKRGHRVELNRQARLRYGADIPKVGREVLEAARRDPRYEEHHRIRRYIICRECGAKLERLSPAHGRVDGLTVREYRRRFSFPPTVCAALGAKISATGKRVRSKLRALARRDMSSVKGHRGEKPMRRWLVLRHLVEGKNADEIGKILNRYPHTVRRIAYGLNLRDTSSSCYDLGRPVTYAYASRLREATGLDPRSFADHFGTPRRSASAISYPRSARHRMPPAQAASIISARDALISEIAERARKPGRRWNPNVTRVLRSLLPDLRDAQSLLRKVLARTRQFLRGKPEAGIIEWQDWLCDQARQEVEGLLPGMLFSNFLPFSPEISQFIEPELGGLRHRGPPVHAANRILAARFGVSSSVINQCPYVRPLPPREMEHWILTMSHGRQAASGDRAAARKKSDGKRNRAKLQIEKTLWFSLGQKIERLIAEGVPLTDARRNLQGRYDYETVVRYHRRYRRAKGLPANSPPPRTT